MTTRDCLKKLEYVGVLAFATVDRNGGPQVRNISAIHYEDEAMYFFTARGKEFCAELLADGHVQVLGYTKYNEMIRLSAVAHPAREDDQQRWIDTIFAGQPYLSNVYPGDTRKLAGIVFEIRNAGIEYFNLGVHPILREQFTLGNGTLTERGYRITDACISCGNCLKQCPQQCITPGKPYQIQQSHCLHCGNCQSVCPTHAVKKR